MNTLSSKTFEELEQKWRVSRILLEAVRDDLDKADETFRNTDKYREWEDLSYHIYNPTFERHWRSRYRTFEEALEEERKIYEALINTKEYQYVGTLEKNAKKLAVLAAEDLDNYRKRSL